MSVSGDNRKIRSGHVEHFEVDTPRIEVSVSIDWFPANCWVVDTETDDVQLELRDGISGWDSIGRYELVSAGGAAVTRIRPEERWYEADDVGGRLSVPALCAIALLALVTEIVGSWQLGWLDTGPTWWISVCVVLQVIMVVAALRIFTRVTKGRERIRPRA